MFADATNQFYSGGCIFWHDTITDNAEKVVTFSATLPRARSINYGRAIKEMRM